MCLPLLHKFFLKTNDKGTLPNYFSEVSVILIQKPDKIIERHKNLATNISMISDGKIIQYDQNILKCALSSQGISPRNGILV
jgi:arginine deiminase